MKQYQYDKAWQNQIQILGSCTHTQNVNERECIRRFKSSEFNFRWVLVC